eukprot:CCRYP_002271-RA/>CCRYP_002271-RA protein AED:0.44 eAED:0.51 QI:0/0/0/1/0/0/2/0/96
MAHPPEDKIKHLNNQCRKHAFYCRGTNQQALFGPDRGAIRGKTVRQCTSKVRPELVSIPRQLYRQIRDVILTADVVFLNGLPFFCYSVKRHKTNNN